MDDSVVHTDLAKSQEERTRLLYGTLHKISLHRLRASNQLPIVQPAHVCDKECDVRPLTGTAYQFKPGREHVCSAGCVSPPNLHRGPTTDLSHVLYICTASGQPHLCSPECCNADKVEHEDNLVCVLTGRCFPSNNYSHGWLQDAAQSGLLQSHLKDTKPKNHQTTDPLLARAQRLVGASFALPGSRAQAYAQCVDRAYDAIRPILPKSPLRDEYDHITRVSNLKRITAIAHKLARNAKQSLNWTTLRVETHNEIQSEESGVHADCCTFDLLARAHARKTCHYLFTVLLTHTQIHLQRTDFLSCVLVLLYMQRGAFRVRNRCIVDVDYSLYHLLPDLVTLPAYPHLAAIEYTNTKSAIQASIIQAIDQDNADPSGFVYPPLQTTDLIWV